MCRPPEIVRAGITKARRRAWARIRQAWGREGILRLEAGVPEETRKALIAMGWPMGRSDGGFGRYECVELRKPNGERVYAAASEMRADGVALAY